MVDPICCDCRFFSFSFFWNPSCDYGFVFLSFGRTSLDYDFMNLNTRHHINWPANACYHDQKQILIPRSTHTLDDSTVKAYTFCRWLSMAYLCVCITWNKKSNNCRRVWSFSDIIYTGQHRLLVCPSLLKIRENGGLVEHGGGHHSQTNKHGFFWRRLW